MYDKLCPLDIHVLGTGWRRLRGVQGRKICCRRAGDMKSQKKGRKRLGGGDGPYHRLGDKDRRGLRGGTPVCACGCWGRT